MWAMQSEHCSENGGKLRGGTEFEATSVSSNQVHVGTNGASPSRGVVASPLRFVTKAVPRVWGGVSLATRLGHQLPTEQPYGETWDISDLPDHSSVVANGPHRGSTLAELWREHRRDFYSSQTFVDDGFPLLIKWLDCRDWLSVQVHPDDSMARVVLRQPRGKSEAWIVLHAEPTARIYAGLRPDVSPEVFLRHLKSGSVDECLHSFTPQPGDCVVLPAGTIHAAGGGLLIAEVQQSSDATFRLFDWNRLGLDGQPRPLQIELGLQAINWKQGRIDPVEPRLIGGDAAEVRGEMVAELHAFIVERYTLSDVWLARHSGELTVWMVVAGGAEFTHSRTGEKWRVLKGQSVLIPSAAGDVVWCPFVHEVPTTLLCIRLSSP
jgi:mannose-6-phosphate isomerase